MTAKSESGMRVLLIGGCGFVGSHVTDEFLSQGWEVVCLGRSPEKFRDPLPQVTYIYGRVGDRSLLEAAMSHRIDCVVHLASTTVPSTSNTDTGFDVRSNLVEALELLECCVKYKVRKLVLASSGGTVYGIPKQLPITEEDPTNPICSYGIVKLALEKYLQLYHRLHGLEYVVLKISILWPRQDPKHVQGAVAVFAGKLIENKPITIWGTGKVVRDFIHVQDLSRLSFDAAVSRVTGIFNASSGLGVSINELLGIMIAQFDVKPQVTRVSSRACDVPATVLSSNKAKQVFGWKPQIALERGIQGVRAWIEQDALRLRLPIQAVTVESSLQLERHTASNEMDMPASLPDLALPKVMSGAA